MSSDDYSDEEENMGPMDGEITEDNSNKIRRKNVIVQKDVHNFPVLVLNSVADVIHHVDVVHHVKICLIIWIISLAKIKNILLILVFHNGLLKKLKILMD